MTSKLQLLPRLIRLRDAHTYLGMDRNRFNAEARPYLTEIPIGRQGIAFTGSLTEAERRLARRLEQIRQEVRIHDLKHTFARRLRAAGVLFEDRQDLLGHSSKSVTTHYSAAELGALIDAVNRISEKFRKSPALVLLKRKAG